MKVIRSLLIVDDNEADVYLTRLLLEQRGEGCFPYILTASDGEEALSMFVDYEKSRQAHPGRFPPAVILLDINMPRMDGFEFLEEMQKLQKGRTDESSVVLMVSSSDDPVERERALKYDLVKRYIVKPPTEADVQSMVESFGEASPN